LKVLYFFALLLKDIFHCHYNIFLFVYTNVTWSQGGGVFLIFCIFSLQIF